MQIVSTVPLPVSRVISTSPSSSQLTFILNPPLAPFNIGTIDITEIPSGASIAGTFTASADPTQPGEVVLQMDSPTFAAARARAVLPFKAVVRFNAATRKVVKLDFLTVTPAQPSASG